VKNLVAPRPALARARSQAGTQRTGEILHSGNQILRSAGAHASSEGWNQPAPASLRMTATGEELKRTRAGSVTKQEKPLADIASARGGILGLLR
jgi:hypothetical protein